MNMARFVVVGFLTLAPLLFSGTPQADRHNRSQHSSLLVDSTSVLVQKVREATLPFLDLREADRAGYGQFLGCISGPQEGAMGVHFVNLTVPGPTPDPLRPNVLIYEPDGDKLRLVAVEWLVPLAAAKTRVPAAAMLLLRTVLVAAPDRDATVSATPFKSRVAPAATVTADVLGMTPALLASFNVPALTVVAPV